MAIRVRARLKDHPADNFSTTLTRLARDAMMGVSFLALVLGVSVAVATSPARAQDTREVVNGNGGGGVILLDADGVARLGGTFNDVSGNDANDGVLASGGFSASAADMEGTGGIISSTGIGDYSISDKIFTNFVTQGGVGSGGNPPRTRSRRTLDGRGRGGSRRERRGARLGRGGARGGRGGVGRAGGRQVSGGIFAARGSRRGGSRGSIVPGPATQELGHQLRPGPQAAHALAQQAPGQLTKFLHGPLLEVVRHVGPLDW